MPLLLLGAIMPDAVLQPFVVWTDDSGKVRAQGGAAGSETLLLRMPPRNAPAPIPSCGPAGGCRHRLCPFDASSTVIIFSLYFNELKHDPLP
jgi:hypothetical protein